ncbi:hypothetical protein K443DRAFT_677547 [Laccaria amethystina LaAM-08-1]|uniref:Uncharacterized protein n=1 Tax=Laccaria amethystina LaAM-08-1 TaxID=1095629 RepID=A0A0C9XXW2_9AGAR|nr:hypothetical protein K443DRAFT_677547 [Laccaria amethystina LaAM-08-1]
MSRHVTPPSITVASGAQYVEYNDSPSRSEATTPFEDSHLLPHSPPPASTRHYR